MVNTSDSGDLVLYDSEVFNVRDFDAVLLPNLLNDDYLKVGVVGSGVTDTEKADSAFVAAVYSTNNYYLSSNGNGVYSTASNFNNIVMPGSVTVTVGVYYDSAILDTGISLSRVAASPSSSPDALHRDIMLKGDDDFTYIYTGNPALAGIGESEGPVYYIGGIDEGIAYDSETHKLAVWHNGAWKDTDRISRSGYYTVLPGRIPVMNFRSGDLSNAPNPFNPSTTVNYSVGEAGIVKLSVYDSRGRLVKVLVERRVDQAGDYEEYWDGRDLRGHEVSSGVYYAVMELNGKRYARKMVMLK